LELDDGSVNAQDNVLRILIIGDSNDKLAVEDWCKDDPTRTLLTDKIHVKTLYSRSKETLPQFVEAYPKRRKSWEIRLCEASPLPGTEDKQPAILVASMTNKFGTKTGDRNFFQPIQTLGGLDGKESGNFSDAWSISELFMHATAPALRILSEACGDLPDGVLVHSVEQDLKHLDTEKPIESSFLDAWETGTIELLRIAKKTFPRASFFTRTANKFGVTENSWNSKEALDTLREMNSKMKTIAPRTGYRLIDFEDISSASYFVDRMRPEFGENVAYIEQLVTQVSARAKMKKGGGRGRSGHNVGTPRRHRGGLAAEGGL
jgi:hypothetical protein